MSTASDSVKVSAVYVNVNLIISFSLKVNLEKYPSQYLTVVLKI